MEEEGRIERALLVSYQKKYDPEKYYSYTIKVPNRETRTSKTLFVNKAISSFILL